MNIYYKIEKDDEEIYGDYLLVLSSDKIFVESFDLDRLENTLVYKNNKLEKISNNYYSFQKEDLFDVKEMVKNQYFVESNELQNIFSEPFDSENDEDFKDDEILETPFETIKTEETEKKEETDEITVYKTGDTINIKNWNDLTSVELIYSYLKNYKKIMNKYDPLLFSSDIKFKNKEFFNALKNNDIATENYIDKISVFYPLTFKSVGHNHINGVFNIQTDVVILLNPELLNKFSREEDSMKLYEKDEEFYDNLYFYWLSIFANENLKNKKSLMIGTIENIKNFDNTKVDNLFEFEFFEIENEIKSVKLNYEMELVEEKQTSLSTEEKSLKNLSNSFIWAFINDYEFKTVGKVKIKTKNNPVLIIEDKDYFETYKDINEHCVIHNEILNSLMIRGLNISTSPTFNVPNYIIPNYENIHLLLSGIENLSYSNELYCFLNDIPDEDIEIEENESSEVDISISDEIPTEEADDFHKLPEKSIEEEPDYDELEGYEEIFASEEDEIQTVKSINNDKSLIKVKSLKADKLNKFEFINKLYESLNPENLEIDDDRYLTEKVFSDILENNSSDEKGIETLTEAFKLDILDDKNIDNIYFSTNEFIMTVEMKSSLDCLGLNKTDTDIYYLNLLVENKYSSAIITIFIKDGLVQSYLPMYGNTVNSNNKLMLENDDDDECFLNLYGLNINDIKDLLVDSNKIKECLNETFIIN